jgi:hypothetical protein
MLQVAGMNQRYKLTLKDSAASSGGVSDTENGADSTAWCGASGAAELGGGSASGRYTRTSERGGGGEGEGCKSGLGFTGCRVRGLHSSSSQPNLSRV